MQTLGQPEASSHRTAVVKGSRIVYDDAGHGEPAVVFIHGAFANRSHFAAQVSHLAERHRVLALDLHGHGESDPAPFAFQIRDFVRDVIGVCDAARLGRTVLCGHSVLGGGIALEVAASRPDLVAGVVMLDAAIPYPEPLRSQQLGRFLPLLEGDAPIAALQAFIGRLFGPYDPPAMKARVLEETGRTPPRMAAPLMRDVFSADFGPALMAGTYPLLLIRATAPADLARLQELRPDVLIGAAVGSGHYVMLVVPDQVNAMLDRFLEIAAATNPIEA